MTKIFWVLFLGYHVFAIVRNVRTTSQDEPAPRGRGPLYWVQAPLMVAAVWAAHDFGAISRALVNPVYISAGFLLGYAIHAVSLVVTNLSKDYGGLASGLLEYFREWRLRARYFVETPEVFFVLAANSIVEETIYRAAAQPLLIGATGMPMIAIAAVAVLFSAGHRHFLRGRLLESIEFLAYALLLGALYFWTGSLILVIVVHTVRNFELHFQKFLIRVEELGGEEQALAAVDTPYRRTPERT